MRHLAKRSRLHLEAAKLYRRPMDEISQKSELKFNSNLSKRHTYTGHDWLECSICLFVDNIAQYID